MDTIIALLCCLLLGIFLKAQGIGALFWFPLGFTFGLFTTAQIVLPVLLGVPRALRFISQRKMRIGVFARLIGGPAVFALLLFAIEFLVGFFWPSVADSATGNGALNAGCWLGIIAIILSPLSRKGRSDFRDDFDRAYRAYFVEVDDPSSIPTSEAYMRLDEQPSPVATPRYIKPQRPTSEENEDLQEDILDFTIIGASHMARGLTEFSAWSKAMLSEDYGEEMRPFLRVIFVNSKDMLERTKSSFEGLE